VLFAMLAAAIGVCVTPMLGFIVVFPVLYPIKFVVAKVSPWDESEDFHPRTTLFMSANFGLACAVCVSGALISASCAAFNRLPPWPLAVVPGAVAFAAAFLAPLVPHPRAGLIPLIAAAVFGVPAAGVAAYVWG